MLLTQRYVRTKVSQHAERPIDGDGEDSGYVLSVGAVIGDARPENMHALIYAG
jgi:hypothetical protein